MKKSKAYLVPFPIGLLIFGGMYLISQNNAFGIIVIGLGIASLVSSLLYWN